MKPRIPTRCLARRPASAMAIALVVLLVVTLVAAVSLQAIVRSHRQTREEEQRVQAELLADSAVSRARLRLLADNEWKGETWKVSLAGKSLQESGTNSKMTGTVTIQAAPGEQARSRLVKVEAVFPDDPVHRARASRQILMTLP